MNSSSNSGKYRVTSRIDKGGMAEVYKGCARTVGNLEKVVAIKRILPGLTSDEKFVRMFLDEARLSMSLNHANIVHTFDVGHADGTWFLVMEYVDGINLKRMLEAARERKTPIPIPAALYITIEVCKALAHAHTKKDKDGRPLGVVHRDVSPPNILISREGGVKLTDFGLAKVRSQLEHTEPGVVKGKFSYLSPDSLSGEAVDSRADIFSLGIVLWEMLANRKLFDGKTDMEVLKSVEKCHIPPLAHLIGARVQSVDEDESDLGPGAGAEAGPAGRVRDGGRELGADLDRILSMALAPDRDKRYQTVLVFARDVAQVLFRHHLVFTSFDLAREVNFYLQEVDEGEDRQQTGGDANFKVIEQIIRDELRRFQSSDLDADAPVVEQPGGCIIDGSQSLLNPADLLDPMGAESVKVDRFYAASAGRNNPGVARYENWTGGAGAGGGAGGGTRLAAGGAGGMTGAGFRVSIQASKTRKSGSHDNLAVMLAAVIGLAAGVLALGIWLALG